jgi:hypothetical protein
LTLIGARMSGRLDAWSFGRPVSWREPKRPKPRPRGGYAKCCSWKSAPGRVSLRASGEWKTEAVRAANAQTRHLRLSGKRKVVVLMRGGPGMIIATRVEQPRLLGDDLGMLRSAERVSNPKMSTAVPSCGAALMTR